MMKWLSTLVLVALVGVCWVMFTKKNGEIQALQSEMLKVELTGDPESLLPKMEGDLNSLEGEKTFNGILLTFLGAGLVGILFVVYLLPFFAHRITHSVYDSAEVVERDVMRDARSLMAQGDYEGSISAFQQAAKADPLNRLPWIEIAKIYKDNLDDPASAIQTIRHALESQAWEADDAAFFLFRLADLYNEVEGHPTSGVAIMKQVIEQFPGTRHSANASHKLSEWSVSAEPEVANAEEAEYFARVQQQAAEAKTAAQREDPNRPAT